MHRFIARTPIYLFIFTLVVITIMFYASNSDYYSTHTSTEPPKSVNVFINDMELIISNEEGVHQAKLVSNKVNHDPLSTITYLKDPVLLLQHENASWHITAKNGQVIHNKNKLRLIEKIILANDVVIVRQNIEQKQAENNTESNNLAFLDLRTSELTYLPKDDLIVTDKKVTITSKESVTTALGLRFNKKTQKLDLLSNVKSVYTSTNNKNLKKNIKSHA